MTTYLIPFFAFLAVILILLLLYGLWAYFFNSSTQAKKQRVQAIHNTLHQGGLSPSSAQTSLQNSPLETWLRSRSRIFEQFENLVQHAHSPLSPLGLMGLMLALFSVVLVLGLLLQTNPLLLLVLAVVIASTPVLWLFRQASKRNQAFGDKLPETLDYLSRALQAGQSLTSAIGMVGKEFPDPIGQEFKTIFDEIGFGIPFKDAIVHIADRVQNKDLNFFVISLMIQHQSGGNLTELLDGLAKTIRERVKLRGKVRTLSSEGRASAWILSALPFVFAAFLMLIKPDYILVLWTTPQGHNLILICFVLITIGFFLLDRITKIKV